MWPIKTEEGELKKLENLIKRMPLICLHLERILTNIERQFGGISKNISEGHTIFEKFKTLQSDLGIFRRIVTALLTFIEDRELTIGYIKKELLTLKDGFIPFMHSVSEDAAIHGHVETIKEILEKGDGHLNLASSLIRFVFGFDAKLRDMCDLILSEPKAIPVELKLYEDEFLYYLVKLVGALHTFCKLLKKVEKLEDIEEHAFRHLYDMIGNKNPPQGQKTSIIEQIEELEQRFG